MNPRTYRRLFLRAIGIVLLQVWVFNNTYFLHMINPQSYSIFQPMIYPLIIMFLPFDSSRSTVIIASFVLGIVMDVFTLSYGLHILAMLISGNMRNLILKNIELSPNLLESDNMPTMQTIGVQLFAVYGALFIGIHHLVYFLLQSFTVSSFLYNIVVTFCSTLLSIILIIIWELIFDRGSARK